MGSLFSLKPSIATKMILLLSLILTIVLSFFGYAQYKNIKSALYNKQNQDLNYTVQRLLLSLPKPLWNYEEDFARKIIESEMRPEWVVSILIQDMEGNNTHVAYKNKNDEVLFDLKYSPIGLQKSVPLEFIFGDEVNPLGQVIVYTNDNAVRVLLRHQILVQLLQQLGTQGKLIILLLKRV